MAAPSHSLSTAPPLPIATPGTVPIASGQFQDPIQNAAAYGPPDWVQTGVRLSFYGAAASVAQSYYTYEEAPDGEWTDPATGKRYNRTDQDGADMPTAAGEAYTQTDVLAIEGDTVVLSTTMYSIDLLSGQLVLNPLGGFTGPGAAVDGAWINPTLLRDLQTSGYAGQQILRGPYAVNGSMFDSVSFVSRAPGAYQDSTFDAASGVLLKTNSSVEGAGSPVHGPLDEPQGNVQMSYTRLVGVRQLTVPGLGAAVPSWVASTPSLAYTGTCTVVNPMDPSAIFSWPMQTTVTFDSVGQTWASFTSQSTVNFGGYQQPSESKGVTGATGAYWYDPQTLATFTDGQVLDEDPVTGATVTVESASPAGGGLVTLTTEMNGGTVRLGYDSASGVLVTFETTQTTTGTTIQLQLAQG
jgi:hypothetical protein